VHSGVTYIMVISSYIVVETINLKKLVCPCKTNILGETGR